MSAVDFWKWFEENNTKYLFLNDVEEDVKKQLLEDLLTKLQNFSDKLFYEIGHHPDNAEQELVITANGDLNYFDKVEELVNAAPEIKDWKIIAFKPAIGFEFSIDYNGLNFDPAKTWFQPLELEERPLDLGLRVCYPDYNSEKEEDFISGTFLMLDAGLGEKTTALDIKYLEVDKTPVDPEQEGMLPLKELGDYISWLKEERVRNN
jgi:hypothetical protein